MFFYAIQCITHLLISNCFNMDKRLKSSPLLSVDNKLVVAQTAGMRALDDYGDGCLNVVTIFGDSRGGKSTLMTLLAGQKAEITQDHEIPWEAESDRKRHSNLFHVSHQSDPCTKGADIALPVPCATITDKSCIDGPDVALVDVEVRAESDPCFKIWMLLNVMFCALTRVMEKRGNSTT